MFKKQKGFTLVELSLVLVIIGLIIAGILYGRDLISQAGTRDVINQLQQYETAVYTFRAKYNYYPGDFPNATIYWGTFSGGCPNGGGTGTETCNGDGDGVIRTGVSNNAREIYAAWKHLANAGLVEGAYTGASTDGSADRANVGVNIPRGARGDSGYGFIYHNIINNTGTNYPYVGTRIVHGNNNTANVVPNLPTLTIHEAYNVDLKIDNGLPSKGKLMTGKPNSTGMPNCATSNDIDAALYNFAYAGVACGIYYNLN